MSIERQSSEEVPPATFGGKGWIPRAQAHEDDLEEGRLWHSCGLDAETGSLRAVLLHWPGEELILEGDPNSYLMLEQVNLRRLRHQTQTLRQFFASRGVEVHIFRPRVRPPPNMLFMRDLFCMTPQGAVLARMAAAQRAGEERFAALALIELGIPVIAMARGRATLEGADVLWMRPDVALVGVGQRTNLPGYEFIKGLLASMNVETVAIPMPEGTQHLLGVVNFIARDLATVRQSKAPPVLLDILQQHGVQVIAMKDDDEVVRGRAMNFVCLADKTIVMPSGCPKSRKVLEAHGVSVSEVNVSEYLKAGGALGCLTGIVRREAQGGRGAHWGTHA